jgi:dihydrofolate reductase
MPCKLLLMKARMKFLSSEVNRSTTSFPLADKLYVTIVEGSFEGDVYFPEIDPEKHLMQWEILRFPVF